MSHTHFAEVAQNWQTDDLIHCRLRAAGVRQAKRFAYSCRLSVVCHLSFFSKPARALL